MSRLRIVDLICAGILICACLAISLPRFRIGIDWADEGFLSYSAVRVMEGQIPNRDFVSLQPPLSFYVVASTFKLLGTSLGSLRILGLAIYFSMALLIYGIARRLLQPMLSLAAALPAAILGIPTFNFVPFAVWQGIAVTLLAIWLFLGAIFSKRPTLGFVAGILTTISTCLRQDQGLYLAVSSIVFVICLKFTKDAPVSAPELKRVLLCWIAGGAISSFVLLAWWWMQGALPEMFNQLIVFPLTRYGKTSSLPFPHFSGQVQFLENALTALFYFPPVIFALVGSWLVRRIVRREFSLTAAVTTFLLVWSALFYCQVLTRSDLSHLLITLPPFFLLTAFCWNLFLGNFEARKIVTVSIWFITAAVVCLFLWIIHPFVLPDTAKTYETVDVSRGGVRIDGGRGISDFVNAVQQQASTGRSILALPYQPMFYFLCERRNPTRWNYIWPGDQTLADYKELVAESKRDPPALVLITGEDDMASYAAPILDYVHEQFQPAASPGRIRVYFPRDATH